MPCRREPSAVCARTGRCCSIRRATSSRLRMLGSSLHLGIRQELAELMAMSVRMKKNRQRGHVFRLFPGPASSLEQIRLIAAR